MRKELLIALENGELGKIQALHSEKSLTSENTFQGDNALHIAAREGHKQIVGWIRAQSLESDLADGQNNDQNTPLHEAARNGDADLVGTLLERKERCTSQRNKFGETPLIIACKNRHKDAVIKFLGANVTETQETNDRGEVSLLYAAVQGGSVEIVKEILNHCSAWDDDLMTKRDESGRCAIHIAAMNGRWDIITEIISKRPDAIEIRSSDHKSVLHFAVQYNQLEVVKNLLEGKKISKRTEMVSGDHDISHNTALHLAAKCPVDLELLNLLLFRGVDMDARNDDGLTAVDILSLAAKDNPDCLQIVKKLKRAGMMCTRRMPDTSPSDVVNTHMVVASLIATITFATIFQIPGGIEDDKNSIHYGVAKMAFSKLFRLFVFSDSAAFITSLSVVVIWLIKRQWQETPLATLIPHDLSDISEVNLLISIFWTIVTFVVATIIVVVPSDYEKLKNKNKEAFDKYQLFWMFEIWLVMFLPYFAAYFFVSLNAFARVWRRPLKRRSLLSREPGIFGILLCQFSMMTVLILSMSFY